MNKEDVINNASKKLEDQLEKIKKLMIEACGESEIDKRELRMMDLSRIIAMNVMELVVLSKEINPQVIPGLMEIFSILSSFSSKMMLHQKENK